MRLRSYEGEADVARLQDCNADSIAVAGGCGDLHPGDIVHHLFNGNNHFDPAESNTATSALYRSAGFGPRQVIDGYVKPIG